MKKIIYYLVIMSLIILPSFKVQALTMAQYQANVDKYTKQLEEKQRIIKSNNEKVSDIKKKISDIEKRIEEIKKESIRLQKEIDEDNKKIENKTIESKKIIEYTQMANGENAYLEYVFGAESITDMIYRVSVAEQLADHNNEIIKELNELVEKNKKQKEQLAKDKKEQEELEEQLKVEKAKIEKESAAVKELMPSIKEQLDAAKAGVKRAKELGCGKNEDLDACYNRIISVQSSSGGGVVGSVPSSNGTFRPISNGYPTWGYEGYPGHMGFDVSSTNKKIPAYPIAGGIVIAKYYDDAGALCVKIKHNINGKTLYGTYAHFRSFGNISKGQYVTPSTMIGIMGSTGNSSGPHVHLELTTCNWGPWDALVISCDWDTYKYSTVNPASYVSFPSSWNNR